MYIHVANQPADIRNHHLDLTVTKWFHILTQHREEYHILSITVY